MIEKRTPWKLAKDPSHGEELVLRFCTILAEAFGSSPSFVAGLPKAAHGIFDQLNWKMELSGKEERFSLGEAEWGKLPDGHVVGKPTPLFPRIEQDAG